MKSYRHTTVDWQSRVEDNLALVRRLTRQIAERSGLVDSFEDLLQAGFIGLIEASQKYDQNKEVAFECYAKKRIEGAVYDEIRKNDWRPRRVSKQLLDIREAVHRLQQRVGRPPGDAEIADELGITLGEYTKQLHEIDLGEIGSLDDQGESVLDSGVDAPENETRINELSRKVDDVLQQFGEKEQQLLYCYYVLELNQREIADVLGISLARVSQLHKSSLIRLKSLTS